MFNHIPGQFRKGRANPDARCFIKPEFARQGGSEVSGADYVNFKLDRYLANFTQRSVQ
jgi:hypothetical protein